MEAMIGERMSKYMEMDTSAMPRLVREYIARVADADAEEEEGPTTFTRDEFFAHMSNCARGMLVLEEAMHGGSLVLAEWACAFLFGEAGYGAEYAADQIEQYASSRATRPGPGMPRTLAPIVLALASQRFERAFGKREEREE